MILKKFTINITLGLLVFFVVGLYGPPIYSAEPDCWQYTAEFSIKGTCFSPNQSLFRGYQ